MKKLTRTLALVLALAICFSCMAMSVFAENKTLTCGKEEHTHSDACDTDDDGSPDCGKQEHTHVDSCYKTEDPKPTTPPSSSSSSSAAPAPAKAFKPVVPNTTGNYRTSAANIIKNVKPAEVAQQELYIDPVTNTIANLYDSMGNLIPCTLSSDGHFYIIPSNDGYAYIPTGR